MPRTLLCLVMFTLAMGGAGCSDEAAAPLTAPEGALLAASSSPGLCVYEGNADYTIQVPIRDYCPSSVVEQWQDEDGAVVQENTFWFAGHEDGGEGGEDFEHTKTAMSEEGGEVKCQLVVGSDVLKKIITFFVPTHARCPNEIKFRRPIE